MSKTFSSKSLDHIKSYPVVQKTINYALSYNLIAAVSTYATALTNYIYSGFLVKLPLVANTVTFVDTRVNTLVLDNVDKTVGLASKYSKKGQDTLATYKKKGEDVLAAYKKKGEDTVALYKKKGEDTVAVYLKPVNDYASSTVDKVLPRAKDAVNKTEEATANEISKSIEIVNDTLGRTRSLISNKSLELSSAVVSTYNKEFDASADKNYYAKVASASVNTGVTLLKNVNADYIQPLRATTQNYVNDVTAQTKAKAEEVVNHASDIALNEPALNGLATSFPVVSASA